MKSPIAGRDMESCYPLRLSFKNDDMKRHNVKDICLYYLILYLIYLCIHICYICI